MASAISNRYYDRVIKTTQITLLILGFLLVALFGYLVPSLILTNTWLAALGLVAASLVVVFAIFAISLGRSQR